MSEATWYYARGGQQLGPVPWEALVDLARLGQLSPADLIWTTGMANWQPAGQTPGLFDAGAAAQGSFPPAGAYPSAGAFPPAGGASRFPAAPYAPAYPGQPGQLGYYAPQQQYLSYAGFWLRFVAWLVDFIIGIVGGVIIGGVIGGIAGASGLNPRSQAWTGVTVLIQLSAAAGQWLYFALMESSAKQATLGKLAVGLAVTDLNGRRIGFGRATGRYFGKFLSALILLMGYVMAGFTERKQALHDILAGTLVVNRR